MAENYVRKITTENSEFKELPDNIKEHSTVHFSSDGQLEWVQSDGDIPLHPALIAWAKLKGAKLGARPT